MTPRVAVPVPCALRFAYEGRRFDGFARQPQRSLRTVEGALLKALVEVGAIRDPASCGYRPGSRTDRGVSARENVVAFRSLIPPHRLPGAVVGRVEGLWPLGAAAVAPGFDPRRAKYREYRFFLSARELPGSVGPADLARVMSVFVGRHDFTAFAKREPHRSPVREVLEVDVKGEGDRREGLVVIHVRGASFLWQQVRRMVAAALGVVRGDVPVDEVRSALEDPQGPGPWGVAPASRLVLWRVFDPRVSFQVPQWHMENLEPDWAGEWGEAMASLRLFEDLLGRS